MPFRPISWWSVAIVGLTIALSAASQTWASGGPENVLLVVNPLSPDSLCIANHYAKLRQIPPENILFVDWDPKQENTDVDTFRKTILLPVLEFAKRPIRGRQIDYVVYSADFPWGIHIDEDIKKIKAILEKQEEALEKQEEGKRGKAIAKSRTESVATGHIWTTFTPLASINGLTYLWQPVWSHVFYFDPRANWYAGPRPLDPRKPPKDTKETSVSFSSAAGYDREGNEVPAGRGPHYLLSMVLAVTSGRGNTRAEVLRYLTRSAAADGTLNRRHPGGTVYFMRNGDIRATVRQPGFAAAVEKLKDLGAKATILDGVVPEGKNDVQGAMVGAADFDWKASKSTILPGAICEHFTSFGGDLHSGSYQTPLSVWLRYGAAASSGTVTEPYAVAYKFPWPMMQVHYARGCTVAESFYQSISSPYQLLIVGDPLCRPWANIPEIAVRGLSAGQTVHDEIKIQAEARFAEGVEAERFEMIIDGRKVSERRRENVLEVVLEFDTAMLGDGAHELRVVALSKGPVPARGEKIIPFTSANHKRTIQVTWEPKKVVSLKKSLIVTVKSPKSTRIRILRGTRPLRTIMGDDGQVEIPAERLGLGPVRLQVVGAGEEDSDEPNSEDVYAPPLDIVVEE